MCDGLVQCPCLRHWQRARPRRFPAMTLCSSPMTAVVEPVDFVDTLDRAAIARLVRRFYTDVRSDALLGPIFEPHLHAHWEAHLVRMTDFWCAAMKVQRGFRGNVYGKHMALAGVTPAHLGRWLWLWRRDSSACMDAAAAARLQYVAIGVARVMHLGWFGSLPSRAEVLALLQSSGIAPDT